VIRAVTREELILLALTVVAAGGCRVPPTVLDPRPVCEGELCVRPRELPPVDWTVAADVQAPPASRLKNAVARDALTKGEPCQHGVPVAMVVIDGVVVHEGPLAIAGAHRLELQFPAAPEPSPDRPIFTLIERVVELDLEVAGQKRCLRVPVIVKVGS
jgi:hypothetical protein